MKYTRNEQQPELPFKRIGLGHSSYKEEIIKLKERASQEKDMDDSDIRGILINKLKHLFLTAEERSFSAGGNTIFDVVVGHEKTLYMAGFEIKSDKDTFNRLKTQLHDYLFIFDAIYIVVHKKDPPEWLPRAVGVIRIFENGDIFIVENAWQQDQLSIGTNYDWDAIFKANGLGESKRALDTLKLVEEVKRNIIFNRFFAVSAGYDSYDFEKFYPFTDKQKSLLIGFDVPYHYKILVKDLKRLEKRFENIVKAVQIGQKALGEFE